MEKKFKIYPPMMPNSVRFETGGSTKQDGIKSQEVFDIAEFTQEEAEEFAKLIHDTFLEHYKIRKENLQKEAIYSKHILFNKIQNKC